MRLSGNALDSFVFIYLIKIIKNIKDVSLYIKTRISL